MVRAILDGRKTQTRRVVKVPWKGSTKTTPYEPYYVDDDGVLMVGIDGPYRPFVDVVASPYGVVGDRLWVKEAHRFTGWGEDGFADVEYLADGALRVVRAQVDDFDAWVDKRVRHMQRSGAKVFDHGPDAEPAWPSVCMPEGVAVPATPSIFMQRWASRLTLEVTGVRVERLQSISEEDATAEGFEASYSWAGHAIMVEDGGTSWQGEMNPLPKVGDMSGGMRVVHVQPTPRKLSTPARDFFANTWRTLHSVDSWNANPWVWVVEFKAVTP